MTQNEARRRQALARWHRRLAVVVGLWLLTLAVTGVLINHAHDWGLDRSPLPASVQRTVYGVEPGEDFCHYAVAVGQDCRAVFAELGLLAGSLLLSPTKAYLLDSQGRLVEAVAAAQLGVGELVAGFADGERVYLRGPQRTVETDPDLLEWRAADAAAISGLDNAPWRARGAADGADLTWERLLLDLHAARFLGPAAKLASDFLAGLILVLGLTGGWLYLVKRRRN